MRTDTQRLEVILNALHGSGDDAFLEAWQAAHTLGMTDRIALDAAIDARRVEIGEAMPPLTALDMLVAEMGRIRNVKGHTEAQDDTLDEGQLSDAAVAYLLQEDYRGDMGGGPEHWPFERDSFKPSFNDRKREVTKGCALALCELERLLRIDADVAGRQGTLTLGVDLASGPDQCVIDGVLQPQPREFKVGDRVICNDPDYASVPKDARGTITSYSGSDLWRVLLDGKEYTLSYSEREMEHADE